MMDLSLAGLIGAIVGTVVAAVIYHALIDRALRTRAPAQTAEEREAAEFRLSVVRRTVLTVDLFIFAALGYWLGRMFER